MNKVIKKNQRETNCEINPSTTIYKQEFLQYIDKTTRRINRSLQLLLLSQIKSSKDGQNILYELEGQNVCLTRS